MPRPCVELEEALAADTGRDVVTLRHDTDRDLILPATAAVAYGLADHVLEARVPVGVTEVAAGRSAAGRFDTTTLVRGMGAGGGQA